MPYIFQQIQDKAIKQGIGQQDVADAREWFRDEARKINAANPTRFMNDPSFKKENRLNLQSIGKMYMFFYDPKLKEQLPFYDTFPLVFPIDFRPNGFLGINLHYLPPLLRARLMDNLYTIQSSAKYNQNQQLNLSYQMLSSAAKFRYFKPCVKHYLWQHVRSSFLNVDPSNWDMALMLPLEQFQKASKQQVWNESQKQFRR
jgi:hypothetical protein